MRKHKGGAAAPPVSHDEAELFREAVADAKPLPPPSRVVHPRPPLPPVPLQSLNDEQQVLADAMSDHIPWDADIELGDELSFVRDGVSRHVLRKLRRGFWIVQAELDLHGLVTSEARPALAAFLADCRRRNIRCVRIIHGKGLGSKNREPVLKHKVKNWLMQRDEVLAFTQARPVDGGSGAAIVLLKAG